MDNCWTRYKHRTTQGNRISSYVANVTDGRGHTSISEAAAQGHDDLIRLLLAEGANPNALNDSGRSALWRSCYNGHTGALKLLLEAGADPSFRDKVSRANATGCLRGFNKHTAATPRCHSSVYAVQPFHLDGRTVASCDVRSRCSTRVIPCHSLCSRLISFRNGC